MAGIRATVPVTCTPEVVHERFAAARHHQVVAQLRIEPQATDRRSVRVPGLSAQGGRQEFAGGHVQSDGRLAGLAMSF